MRRQALLLGVALLGGCHSPPSRVSPPSDTRATLLGGDCPVGFIRLRSAHADVVADVDGNALIPSSERAMNVRLEACGREASFTIDAGATNVTFRLPPSVGETPWRSSASTPATARSGAPCTFPVPASRRVVAGAFRSLRRDPAACALWAERDEVTWLVPPASEALRLDRFVIASGARAIVAMDSSRQLVVIDRATGARTPVTSDLHRASMAPKSEVLLLHGEPGATSTPLELRWPDGHVRRLTNRARPETAWSDDGRWLVYLSGASTDACSDVHVVDAASGVDRVATPLCHLAGWGAPEFVTDHHVVLGGDESVVVETRAAAVERRIAGSAWVTRFPGGVLVQTRVGDVMTDHATIANLASGASVTIPFRVAHANPLPWGDLLVFRRRHVPSPHEADFDALLVDPKTGSTKLVAQGVKEELAVGKRVLVLAELDRFVVVPLDGSARTALPSLGQSVETFSADDRWVRMRGPMMKGSPAFFALARLDGRERVRVDHDSVWASDLPVAWHEERRFTGDVAGVRAHWTLFREDLGPGRARDVEVAKDVESFVALDGDQLAYVVPGDGIYLDSMERP